jgi:cell division protein FtsW
MAGVLLRATFEINRALDTRAAREQLPAAVAAVDVSASAPVREAVSA